MAKLVTLSSTPYIVSVYNKDGGYYDDIHTTHSESMAMRIAGTIARIIKKDGYRDPATGEPYDWVTIFHGDEGRVVNENGVYA